MGARTCPQFELAAQPRELFLAFDCRATHEVSLAADALASEFLNGAPDGAEIVLDLADAHILDSTFAGWLLKLRRGVEQHRGRVILSRCSTPCRNALRIMGLTELFVFADHPRPTDVRRVSVRGLDEGTPTAIEFMLHAHDDLANARPENEPVFRPIADVLRAELKRRES